MKRSAESLDSGQGGTSLAKRPRTEMVVVVDHRRFGDEDEDHELLDVLTVLGRKMPGWMVELMSLLCPRDICSLMATSRRLSIEFLETNNLYRLGMAGALGGRLRLSIPVRDNSVEHSVRVTLSAGSMESAEPNKAFSAGRRLAKALRAFRDQGDTWLGLVQAVQASLVRGYGRNLKKGRCIIKAAILEVIAEHATHLQKCWLEAFAALNVLPCVQGARAFMSTCERIVRASLADDSAGAINMMQLIKKVWHNNKVRSLYYQANIVPGHVLDLPHHMWFALDSVLDVVRPSVEAWSPVSLWMLRWMSSRLRPTVDVVSAQDASSLSSLLVYMKADFDFRGGCRDFNDALLEWASEDNLKACGDRDTLFGLAHAALDMLKRARMPDTEDVLCSMRSMCLIIMRVCRRLGQSLRDVTLGDSHCCPAIVGVMCVWTDERLVDVLAPLLDMNDIRRFYEDQLKLVLDGNSSNVGREGETPLSRFLKVLSAHARRTKSSGTSLDPELIDRMRQSLELTFQCFASK
ncbi:hypothetical protein ml_49 [Mollivirus sibericum]|uniref:hypothetical protein n=1 Tax=Mollivirus sibericum TaxID=1678078 RepID=UPI0006B2E5DB|nr:hypothetical protein ml_49 [Mollivirus sibericum]ALD61851.1 hypothetical protein ml_49 [Mollivirus sibericum]